MKYQPVRLPASLPCASPLLTAPVLLPFLLIADGSPDAPGLAHQAGQRLRWVFSPIRKPVLLMLALGVLLLHVWQGWPWRLLMQAGYAASCPVSLLAETKPCFELLFRLPGKVRQALVVAGSCSWPAAEAAAISPQELWPIRICRLCTVVHQQVRCLQRLLPACLPLQHALPGLCCRPLAFFSHLHHPPSGCRLLCCGSGERQRLLASSGSAHLRRRRRQSPPPQSACAPCLECSHGCPSPHACHAIAGTPLAPQGAMGADA